ncbi:hypothetical protein LCGC14_3076510, partial [marine sediment metagenome]
RGWIRAVGKAIDPIKSGLPPVIGSKRNDSSSQCAAFGNRGN